MIAKPPSWTIYGFKPASYPRTHTKWYSSSKSLRQEKELRIRTTREAPKQSNPYLLDEPEDWRPQWLIKGSNILRYALIPPIVIYAVFFHDFGPHEHSFSPARRWLKEQKTAFFTLNPEEQALVESNQAGRAEKKTSSVS